MIKAKPIKTATTVITVIRFLSSYALDYSKLKIVRNLTVPEFKKNAPRHPKESLPIKEGFRRRQMISRLGVRKSEV